MELTIPLLISIIGVVISVSSFALNRGDKSKKDTGDYQYRMGILETKVDNVLKQVDKILSKLDYYDEEIDTKIKNAMEEHIKVYHKG